MIKKNTLVQNPFATFYAVCVRKVIRRYYITQFLKLPFVVKALLRDDFVLCN